MSGMGAQNHGAELLLELADEQAVSFHMVPNWADEMLDVYEYRVFGAIRRMAKPDAPAAWPSVKTLAERTGISERKVQQVIKSLVSAGALRVIRRKNASGGDASSCYVVAWVDPRTQCTPGGACGAPPRVHEVHPNNNHIEQEPIEQDCSRPELALEGIEVEIVDAINEVPRFKKTYLQDISKAHHVLKRLMTKAEKFGIPPSEVLSIARRCANYHSGTKAFSHGMLVLEDWVERDGKKREPQPAQAKAIKPVVNEDEWHMPIRPIWEINGFKTEAEYAEDLEKRRKSVAHYEQLRRLEEEQKRNQILEEAPEQFEERRRRMIEAAKLEANNGK